MTLRKQAKHNQIIFFFGILLVLFGLFLPWYSIGDFLPITVQPFVIRLKTTFTEAGGRVVLPSIEQHLPAGVFALHLLVCLIALEHRSVSPKVGTWVSGSAAFLLLAAALYYFITLWGKFFFAEIPGRTPPGFGLYIFLLGSIILFLRSLRVAARDIISF